MYLTKKIKRSLILEHFIQKKDDALLPMSPLNSNPPKEHFGALFYCLNIAKAKIESIDAPQLTFDDLQI